MATKGYAIRSKSGQFYYDQKQPDFTHMSTENLTLFKPEKKKHVQSLVDYHNRLGTGTVIGQKGKSDSLELVEIDEFQVSNDKFEGFFIDIQP